MFLISFPECSIRTSGPKSVVVYLYLLSRVALTPPSTPHSSFFHTALFYAAQHKHSTRRPPTAFLCLLQIQWLCFSSNSVDVINYCAGVLFNGTIINVYQPSCSMLLDVVHFNLEFLFTPKCLNLSPSSLTPVLLIVQLVLFCNLGQEDECRLSLKGWFSPFGKAFAELFPNTSDPSSPPTLLAPGAKHTPFQQGLSLHKITECNWGHGR